MFIALISTIMASFSDVFWKKSLNYDIRPWAHELSSYVIPLSLFLYFLFFTSFQITDLSFWVFLSVFIIILFDTVRLPVMQQIYKEEKMSVIMPYLSINRILVIIWSFFIFSDVSYTALCITILAILVIIWWSIDFKTFQIPRNLKKILFTEIIKTIWILVSGWLIIRYWEILFFNTYVIIWCFMALILVWYYWQWEDFKKVPGIYWKERILWSIWWISWFLSLVLIKNLWLSISVLLWFIWIWVTLLFSYIFLKDIPSKKDIWMTLIIAMLVWIWYYFK